MERENKNIIIIDDEPSIRKSLAAFLEDMDYRVSSLESSEEGLEKIKNSHFDIAVVDLRLNGIRGDEFIIKAHNINPQMSFLIYTGSVNFRISKELIDIGLRKEDILHKPLSDLTIMLQAIENLLTRKDLKNGL